MLIGLFLIALYFYSKFFTIISYKIRIVLKNTVSKGADFKNLYYGGLGEYSKTEMYTNLEIAYRKEVLKRKNFYFKNIFVLMVERFHRPFYLPFRNKVIDKLVLLRPPTSFFYMTYLSNLIFLWSLAIIIVGGQSNAGDEVTVSTAFGWSILVGCLGSLITFIVTFLKHRLYAKEIKRIFLIELEEEQERVFRTAFVGELINIQNDDEHLDRRPLKSTRLDESGDNDNQTEISTARRFLTVPEKGWKDREDYRLKVINEKKYNKKDRSILQVRTKRLNVLEECRALKIIASSTLPTAALSSKGDKKTSK